MTVERMNELIRRLEGQKAEYDARMEKKIAEKKRERDMALAAQTQRIFTRHRLDPDELNKLKFASREQLKRVLDFIDSEIREPEAEKQEAEPDVAKQEITVKEKEDYEKNGLA